MKKIINQCQGLLSTIVMVHDMESGMVDVDALLGLIPDITAPFYQLRMAVLDCWRLQDAEDWEWSVIQTYLTIPRAAIGSYHFDRHKWCYAGGLQSLAFILESTNMVAVFMPALVRCDIPAGDDEYKTQEMSPDSTIYSPTTPVASPSPFFTPVDFSDFEEAKEEDWPKLEVCPPLAVSCIASPRTPDTPRGYSPEEDEKKE